MKEETVSEKSLKRKTLLAFVFFLIAILSVVFFWMWFKNIPKEQGIQPVLRTGFEANERLFTATGDELKLVRTYPKTEAVQRVRVNGNLGMRGEIDTATWRMQIVKKNGDTLRFSLEDVMRLPKTEVIFDFKCIEGWSQKTWWGGVKVSDFIKHYGLEKDAQFNYAGIATPDKKYYVGLDMPSFQHPQTLLCYEMNGAPLPPNQGYPLRLIIPVKYGIKHIKRIGTVYFSNQRPPDYWAEQGYDYHSGH